MWSLRIKLRGAAAIPKWHVVESSDRLRAGMHSSLPSSETAAVIPQATAGAFANATFGEPESQGIVNSQSSPEK